MSAGLSSFVRHLTREEDEEDGDEEGDGADLVDVTHEATRNGPLKKTQPLLHAFFGSTSTGTKDEKRKAARMCDRDCKHQREMLPMPKKRRR